MKRIKSLKHTSIIITILVWITFIQLISCELFQNENKDQSANSFQSVSKDCGLFPTYTLSIGNQSEGIGSYNITPEKEEYEKGEEITIQITSGEGICFCGWENNISGWNNGDLLVIDDTKASLIMDSDKSISINFIDTEKEYYPETIPNTGRQLNRGEFSENVYSTGCIDPPIDVFNNIPIAPQVEVDNTRALLNRSLIESSSFPIPSSQGQQGSCTAWAIGFAAKSYFEKKNRAWNLGYQDCAGDFTYKYDHIFSPAFIYNQINGGKDEGSSITKALDLLMNTGICTWEDMPYSDDDYLTQPSSTAIANAGNYKIENYYRINQNYYTFTDSEIQLMKDYLDSGYPIIVSVLTDTTFCYPSIKNTLNEYVWNSFDTAYGCHAMCITGYDETYGFKTMNSWGTDWANDGYIWIDINFFKNNIGVSAYIIIDT